MFVFTSNVIAPTHARARTARLILRLKEFAMVIAPAIAVLGIALGTFIFSTDTNDPTPRAASGSASSAEPSATGSPASGKSLGALKASVPQGKASVRKQSALESAPPRLGGQSLTGAASAFADMAVWTVLSPAAKEDPVAAVSALGEGVLNSGDTQMLASMVRSDGDKFEVADGAYRVLGHSGNAMKPDQVMLEITAPLTLAGKNRWAVIGGVVKWNDDHWSVVSMTPREVEGGDDLQPPVGLETDLLDGTGWQRFAAAKQD